MESALNWAQKKREKKWSGRVWAEGGMEVPSVWTSMGLLRLLRRTPSNTHSSIGPGQVRQAIYIIIEKFIYLFIVYLNCALSNNKNSNN
jgi:hypothetical protein